MNQIPSTYPDHRCAVITGMGAFTPLSRNCAELCDALMTGKDSIAPVTTFDTQGFVGNLVSMFAKEWVSELPEDTLRYLNRSTIFAVIAYREAIAQARLQLDKVSPQRIGVVFGTLQSGFGKAEKVASAVFTNRLEVVTKQDICASLVSHCTGVIKNLCGAQGRVLTVSLACASSNTAVGIAADMIRDGEADIVIAGGTDAVSLSVMAGFNALRAISSTKTAPFGAPPGLTLGEGAGVVIVESLQTARARGCMPRAEVLGYGISGDAHHPTAPEPHGKGMEQVMREALAVSGLQASDIDYINAHGTGSEANDRIESHAILRVFGDRTAVSSIKSFIGHTLGACGVLEVIATLLLAEKNCVPYGLRMETPRENCAVLDYVHTQPRRRSYDKILVNNFGFGGSNSALALSINGTTTALPERAPHKVFVHAIGAITAAGQGFSAFCDAWREEKTLVTIDVETGLPLASAPRPSFRSPTLRPFARSALTVKYMIQALEEALGENTADYRNNARSGIVSGMIFGIQKPIEKFLKSVLKGNPALASAKDFPMINLNAAVGLASIAFGISGYQSAFGGSAAALAYALDTIRRGRQDRMMVVTGDESTPDLLRIFQQVGVLPSESSAFEDTSSQAFGEGAIALNLERGNEGVSSNCVQIAGWAHFPCRKNTIATDDTAMEAAITTALTRAEIIPKAIKRMVLFLQSAKAEQCAAKRALERLLGSEASLPIQYVAPIFGYTPSCGALMAVAGACAAAQSDSTATCVIAAGYDMIGDGFAFVITRNSVA